MIIGLESLIVRVGRLHVRSLALEIKVDEALQFLVHMIDSE